ncbi:MAG: leucyl aminopeptidase [Candidatus Helarchaeota archaeon]
MRIEVEQNSPLQVDTEIFVIGIYENATNSKDIINVLESKLGGVIKERFDLGDFKGAMGEVSIIYTHGRIPAKRLFLVGLGKKEEMNLEIIRQVSGIVVKKIRNMGIQNYKIWPIGSDKTELKINEIGQAIAEGTILGDYRILKHKTQELEDIKIIDSLSIVFKKNVKELKAGVKVGIIIAEATNFTRDLTNEPANVATPTYIAERALDAAMEARIDCKIYGEKEIEQLKMNSFLSVAKGSNKPCKLVVLDYNSDASLETIVLVGKGITFDSGGISLKSSTGMWEMKQDMAGAAAVIGALKASAHLQIPLHIVGITPLTENLPGGRDPNLPGDIITSRKGKTIEILNTDAEGRLILADALDLANEFKPKVVIDIATLTGACRVALGIYASGLFTNDDVLAEKLLKAGEQTQEKLWRLPLWKEHEKAVKSKIADIKNVNLNRKAGAGASSAAAFLKQFIGNYSWAHIDIAGTDYEYSGKNYSPVGASGIGVRLLVQFLRNWSKK